MATTLAPRYLRQSAPVTTASLVNASDPSLLAKKISHKTSHGGSARMLLAPLEIPDLETRPGDSEESPLEDYTKESPKETRGDGSPLRNQPGSAGEGPRRFEALPRGSGVSMAAREDVAAMGSRNVFSDLRSPNWGKISVRRSSSIHSFSEIPGTLFEDEAIGGTLAGNGESNTGTDDGSIASASGDAVYLYSPCTTPLSYKKITIVHQRNHERHSVGEINGTLFEDCCDEEVETLRSPTPTEENAVHHNKSMSSEASQFQSPVYGPTERHQWQQQQTKQQQQQQQQQLQEGQGFRRAHSAQFCQFSSPVSKHGVDNRTTICGVKDGPRCSPLIKSQEATSPFRARSAAPSPRLGSRNQRRSSVDGASALESTQNIPVSRGANTTSAFVFHRAQQAAWSDSSNSSDRSRGSRRNSISASTSSSRSSTSSISSNRSTWSQYWSTRAQCGYEIRKSPAPAAACGAPAAVSPAAVPAADTPPVAAVGAFRSWRESRRCVSVNEIEGSVFEQLALDV